MAASAGDSAHPPNPMMDPRYFIIRGLNGIRNMGNTCYLNSIIQCLSNVIPLTRYVLEKKEFEGHLYLNKSKKEIKVAVYWYHTMNQMWNNNKILEPVVFKRLFGEIDPRVSGFDQNDAHEIFLSLLNVLHDSVSFPVEMNISGEPKNPRDLLIQNSYMSWKNSWEKQYSKIVELFAGQLYMTTKCPHCQYKSQNFEPFFLLSLPILSKHRNLYDCIQTFQETEILDDENKWKCDHCEERVNAERKIELWRLPNFLILSFKRFNQRSRKINQLIQFNETINLQDFLPVDDNRPANYRIHSTIHHEGGTGGGHYYANVRKLNGKWIHFNDHSVRMLESFDMIDKHTAYVLIYQKV